MPGLDFQHDAQLLAALTAWQALVDTVASEPRTTGLLVEPDHAALEQIGALIDVGWLRVLLDRVLLLEDAAKAHEFGEAGRNLGKAVLTTQD